MVRNADPNLDAAGLEIPEAFTQASLGGLERQIDAASAGNPRVLALDMRRVKAVDSAALNWLLATQARLAELGIRITLRNPSALATDAFIATRLEHRFELVSSAMRPEGQDA